MKTYLIILVTIFATFNIVGDLGAVGAAEPKIAEYSPDQAKPAAPKVSPARKKTSTEIEKLGNQKLLQISQLEDASSNNVIRFSVSDYQRLVLKNPRPYDVVMLFNVKQHCKHCDEVEAEYKSMVYSFVRERGKGGSTKGMEKEKKIFFGVLYFNQDKDV